MSSPLSNQAPRLSGYIFMLYLTNRLAQLCLCLSYSCQAFRPVASILWPTDDKEDQMTVKLAQQKGGWKETVEHHVWARESCATTLPLLFYRSIPFLFLRTISAC